MNCCSGHNFADISGTKNDDYSKDQSRVLDVAASSDESSLSIPVKVPSHICMYH